MYKCSDFFSQTCLSQAVTAVNKLNENCMKLGEIFFNITHYM